MALANRKATHKLYPYRAQSEALREMLVLHQRLCTACLEQRKWAYEWRNRIKLCRCRTDKECRCFTEEEKQKLYILISTFDYS